MSEYVKALVVVVVVVVQNLTNERASAYGLDNALLLVIGWVHARTETVPLFAQLIVLTAAGT